MDIHKAILELDPNAKFIVIDNDVEQIRWESAEISKEDILKKATEIETRDAHIKPRYDAYPSIAKQLDTIYHKGIDEWKKEIKVIKDKFPKE